VNQEQNSSFFHQTVAFRADFRNPFLVFGLHIVNVKTHTPDSPLDDGRHKGLRWRSYNNMIVTILMMRDTGFAPINQLLGTKNGEMPHLTRHRFSSGDFGGSVIGKRLAFARHQYGMCIEVTACI
jgi:hypothetical protein